MTNQDTVLIDQLNKLAAHILKMDSESGEARLIEMASVRIRELNDEVKDAYMRGWRGSKEGGY